MYISINYETSGRSSSLIGRFGNPILLLINVPIVIGVLAACSSEPALLTSPESEVVRLESSLSLDCTSMEALGGPNDYGCLRNDNFVTVFYDGNNDSVDSVGVIKENLDPEFLVKVAEVYGFSKEDATSVLTQNKVVKKAGLDFLVEEGIVKIKKSERSSDVSGRTESASSNEHSVGDSDGQLTPYAYTEYKGLKFSKLLSPFVVMEEARTYTKFDQWCGQDGGTGQGWVPEACQCVRKSLWNVINSKVQFGWENYLFVTYSNNREEAMEHVDFTEEHYVVLRSLVTDEFKPALKSCAKELSG